MRNIVTKLIAIALVSVALAWGATDLGAQLGRDVAVTHAVPNCSIVHMRQCHCGSWGCPGGGW